MKGIADIYAVANSKSNMFHHNFRNKRSNLPSITLYIPFVVCTVFFTVVYILMHNENKFVISLVYNDDELDVELKMTAANATSIKKIVL